MPDFVFVLFVEKEVNRADAARLPRAHFFSFADDTVVNFSHGLV